MCPLPHSHGRHPGHKGRWQNPQVTRGRNRHKPQTFPHLTQDMQARRPSAGRLGPSGTGTVLPGRHKFTPTRTAQSKPRNEGWQDSGTWALRWDCRWGCRHGNRRGPHPRVDAIPLQGHHSLTLERGRVRAPTPVQLNICMNLSLPSVYVDSPPQSKSLFPSGGWSDCGCDPQGHKGRLYLLKRPREVQTHLTGGAAGPPGLTPVSERSPHHGRTAASLQAPTRGAAQVSSCGWKGKMCGGTQGCRSAWKRRPSCRRQQGDKLVDAGGWSA